MRAIRIPGALSTRNAVKLLRKGEINEPWTTVDLVGPVSRGTRNLVDVHDTGTGRSRPAVRRPPPRRSGRRRDAAGGRRARGPRAWRDPAAHAGVMARRARVGACRLRAPGDRIRDGRRPRAHPGTHAQGAVAAGARVRGLARRVGVRPAPGRLTCAPDTPT